MFHNYQAHALEPGRIHSMRGPCTVTREQPLLTATRENPRAAAKTQHSQKWMNKFKKEKENLTNAILTSSSTVIGTQLW